MEPKPRVLLQFERFLLHIHPPKVNSKSLAFNRTFGLGGISLTLLTILFISGIIIRFHYVPTPDEAYNSVAKIQSQSPAGHLLRNVHYFSAILLIISTFLHLLRVFYSQSLYGVRAKNWTYGLLLFLLVLSANFTGYLLPWDQLSYWAVNVVTGMAEYVPFAGKALASVLRGGESVGAETLLNFYNFHTGLIPLILIVLLAMHFWLIRKAKGVLSPPHEPITMVDSSPALVRKEMVAALSVIAVVLLFAVFFNAPLQDKANPALSPNPAKAPWYFLGAQEILLHLHPLAGAVILPLGILILAFLMPRFRGQSTNDGVYFNGTAGKTMCAYSVLYSVALTASLILFSEYFLRTINPAVPVFIWQGIFPIALYIVPVIWWLWQLKRKYKSGYAEVRLSLVTIIVVSYCFMLLVSLILRGEGMKLIF